jgi:RHS repeat-associated protein
MFTERRLALEEESGLYYYRLRYYDPAAGRFISRDPLGLWGDPGQNGNGQSYCGNNPVNRVDPLGLEWVRRPGADGLDAAAETIQRAMDHPGTTPEQREAMKRARDAIFEAQHEWRDEGGLIEDHTLLVVITAGVAGTARGLGAAVKEVVEEFCPNPKDIWDGIRTAGGWVRGKWRGWFPTGPTRTRPNPTPAPDPVRVDIGGEGHNAGATNVNRSKTRSNPGPNGEPAGSPIPDLVLGRGERLPIKTGSADEVFVENVPMSDGILDEAGRITRPGGKIHLGGPDAESVRDAAERLARRTGGQVTDAGTRTRPYGPGLPDFEMHTATVTAP